MIDEPILTAIADALAPRVAPPVGAYLPWRVEGVDAGYVTAGRAQRLALFRDVFVRQERSLELNPRLEAPQARTEALEAVARTLEGEGRLTRWRDERYVVARAFGEPALFLLERAAARFFGIRTYAVHVNGHTVRGGSDHLWIARRSDRKAIDPGQLDNMVGGGVAAGLGVRDTLAKEAFEEAGVDPAQAALAKPGRAITICREQPDGLHLETLFAHDLELPRDFAPRSVDGEVQAWHLMDVPALARALAATGAPDLMTADACLVTVDWLLRRGHVPPGTAVAARLETLLAAPAAPARIAR